MERSKAYEADCRCREPSLLNSSQAAARVYCTVGVWLMTHVGVELAAAEGAAAPRMLAVEDHMMNWVVTADFASVDTALGCATAEAVALPGVAPAAGTSD